MTALSKTILKAKASVEKRAGTAGRWTRTSASIARPTAPTLIPYTFSISRIIDTKQS